ncbi:hypothetical protein B6I21_04540 [candidate division KSB1 bacterium 4572_119]|nr:MAG: hypothetical protein B6I21_04540 [candidate division KSB1 bacterium 4572_119]
MNNKNLTIKNLVKEIFFLPDGTEINIKEFHENHDGHFHVQTQLIFRGEKEQENIYIIKKPVNEITANDIKRLKKAVKLEKRKLHPVLGPVFRFAGWWVAFTGLYSMFAVCPFCGQAGCVVGAGSAGVVGGFFALIMQYGKTALSFFKSRVLNIKT